MPSSSVQLKPRRPPLRRAVPGPVRLTHWRKVGVYAVSLGIWSTGAAWLVFHYFFRRKSQFGFETNPLEPWWLKLHGAFAFAAIATLGLLWGVHVLNGWTSRRRRGSGGALFGVSCFLVASGYLLYYAGDDSLRDWVSLSHWIVGLAAALLLLWHRFWDHELQ